MRSCAHKGEASGREASPQSTAKDAAAFTDKAPLVYVFGERVGVIDCADTRPAAGETAGVAPCADRDFTVDPACASHAFTMRGP